MLRRIVSIASFSFVLAVLPMPSYAAKATPPLKCFLCEGNALTCENNNMVQTCTGPEIYCRLDVNAVNYPNIRQMCSPTCIENVALDGVSYTYCTRVTLGNCYRQQCNRVIYGGSPGVLNSRNPLTTFLLVIAASLTTIATCT